MATNFFKKCYTSEMLVTKVGDAGVKPMLLISEAG
jgi:hypothetical protein